MLGLASKTLGGPGMEEGMTWEQCAERLERTVEDLQSEVVDGFEVEPVNGKLRIWKRARHVVSTGRAEALGEYCPVTGS
jgi:galactokinase